VSELQLAAAGPVDPVAASALGHAQFDELRPDGARQDGARYLARQPILDLAGDVHGYELLFRAGPNSSAFSGDGSMATRTVLDNTLIFGMDKLTGGLPAFVNCTQEAIEDRLVLVLPAAGTVLELLETLNPTPELWQACVDLKKAGYRLALDDFVWTSEWHRFLSLADYVKVDLSVTGKTERMQLIQLLEGCDAQLVAERVETREDLAQARSEGFTLFQGYYFCKPVTMQNQSIPANRIVHVEMLRELQKDPLDTKQVSDLVKRDASLTYRLLRMVNSALYGARQQIRSIHGAIVMIGDAMFRRVAMLAIASELGGDHPSELLRMAFVRGRFCELAALRSGQDATEQYLLGILSLLPAMLSVPMEYMADVLPLRPEVRGALLGDRNKERRVLDWLEFYERGNWESCDRVSLPTRLMTKSAGARFPIAGMPEMYAEALLWAETNMRLAAI
jgi:EAL and modified HD-GYP domain-containing signal transduction protein